MFVGLTASRGSVCCWALRVSGSPAVWHGRLRLRHARLEAGVFFALGVPHMTQAASPGLNQRSWRSFCVLVRCWFGFCAASWHPNISVKGTRLSVHFLKVWFLIRLGGVVNLP